MNDKDSLNLDDLGIYVKKRMAQLTDDKQSVVVTPRADFDPQKIVIARRKGTAPK